MGKKNKEDGNTGQEYPEFRKLLRKGMGYRTQREFAKTIGLTPGHLNRMLNQDQIPRPSKNTLVSMAQHMSTVTLQELLESCGYETDNMEEIAKGLAENLKEFFLKDRENRGLLNASIKELCETFDMLYRPSACESMQFDIEEVELTDSPYNMAENAARITIKWDHTDCICFTTFTLYYAKTMAGKIFVVGLDVEKTPDGVYAQIMKKSMKNSAESRLLDAIFGFAGEKNRYQAVTIGPGIAYDSTPAGFRDFLMNHRDTFCINEERRKQWQQIAEQGMDPDIVFANYNDAGGGTGTGAVIATILTDELQHMEWMKGREFLYMEPCEWLPEEERNAFVMVPTPYNSPDMPKELCIRLYFYAKELQAPEFGLCYYRHTERKDEQKWYKTEDFGQYLS